MKLLNQKQGYAQIEKIYQIGQNENYCAEIAAARKMIKDNYFGGDLRIFKGKRIKVILYID